MDILLQDIRHAFRGMLRARWFTFVVGGTLAVAIAANTVVFSLVKSVLLAPLALGAPERLVAVVNSGVRTGDYISPLDLLDLRERVRGLDGLGGYAMRSVNMTSDAEPLRLRSVEVTANWFTLLGLPLEAGRGFTADEERPDGSKAAILSYNLWRSRFNGDRDVIGRRIRLDDTPYTVVGVASRKLTLPVAPDIWRPFVFTEGILAPRARGARVLQAVGRVRAGTTVAEARAEFRLAAARLHQQYPDTETGLAFDLKPLREHLVGDSRRALFVLFGAVGCVLLVACANVATLQLLRATSRSAEIGIRVALGAGRGRIARQLLIESTLLAALGGICGIALAALAVQALVGTGIGNLPRLDEVAIDGQVLAFTFALMVGTGLLFGLAPAVHAATADVTQSITSGVRGSTSKKRSSWIRSALVVGEITLVVPLLVGAALLGQSLRRLLAVDPGFLPEQVVRFDLTLPEARYDPARMRGFGESLVERLRALPGVSGAAVGFGVPFTDWARNRTGFHIAGQPTASPGQPEFAELKWASPEYFQVLGIPLVRGRMFTNDDGIRGPKAVIVNQAFVRAFLPNQDPVGRSLEYGAIVGVVGDTKTATLSAPAEPAIYQPFSQSPIPYLTVVLRSVGEPGTSIAAARASVAELDPTLPLFNTMSLEDAVGASASRSRLDAWLVGAFAGLALLLAVIGIYSVVSYLVRERRRELAIRVALGGRREHIVGLVLGRGLRLVTLGLGIGLVAALAGSRVLQSLLYGIGPTDPMTYAVVSIMLVAVALAACWGPALRAANVDPATTMKAE
jgi:putative ABC transport system permease protein